ASSEFEQLQVHESAGMQVGTHHRLGHAAPSETGQQKRMLVGEITEPPDVDTHDSVVPLVRGLLLRQDKLQMLPRGPRRRATGTRERMFRSCYRDEWN